MIAKNNIAALIILRRWIFPCDESDNTTSEVKEADPTRQQSTDKVQHNQIIYNV